ncbi:Chemotaxis protein CheY [bacterium HR40]|nr:Chemotaxis protein CheY [bacterium HR40]
MADCLVVDDSPTVRSILCRILTGLGIDTRQAANGAEALERCRERMPDLVLLDWNMPVMNGLECVRALRAMPGGDRPRVIFCTTMSELADIEQALAAGADEYIMKPFDAELLRLKLEQVGWPL